MPAPRRFLQYDKRTGAGHLPLRPVWPQHRALPGGSGNTPTMHWQPPHGEERRQRCWDHKGSQEDKSLGFDLLALLPGGLWRNRPQFHPCPSIGRGFLHREGLPHSSDQGPHSGLSKLPRPAPQEKSGIHARGNQSAPGAAGVISFAGHTYFPPHGIADRMQPYAPRRRSCYSPHRSKPLSLVPVIQESTLVRPLPGRAFSCRPGGAGLHSHP